MHLRKGTVLIAKRNFRLAQGDSDYISLQSFQQRKHHELSDDDVVKFGEGILLLSSKILNGLAILDCLVGEKKFIAFVPEKELEDSFAPYTPEESGEVKLTPMDQWLSAKYDVRGKLFRASTSHYPKVHKGSYERYVGKEATYRSQRDILTGKDTFGTKNVTVVGRAIRVQASARKLVFEFYYNGYPYWWQFESRKLSKAKNFHDYWWRQHRSPSSMYSEHEEYDLLHVKRL